MSPGAVIFDVDGTLVDSEELAHEVLLDMLREHGIDLSMRDAMAVFRGTQFAAALAHVAPRATRPLREDFAAEMRRRQDVVFRERLRAFPGAVDLVRSLTMPIGIASSGTRAKIELSLSLTGLLPYFEGRIFSSYEIGTWKPEPGIFLHAACGLGVAPADCVVVEDSIPGIRAGLAAGMKVLAFRPDRPDLLPPGVPVFERLADVGAALGAG